MRGGRGSTRPPRHHVAVTPAPRHDPPFALLHVGRNYRGRIASITSPPLLASASAPLRHREAEPKRPGARPVRRVRSPGLPRLRLAMTGKRTEAISRKPYPSRIAASRCGCACRDAGPTLPRMATGNKKPAPIISGRARRERLRGTVLRRLTPRRWRRAPSGPWRPSRSGRSARRYGPTYRGGHAGSRAWRGGPCRGGPP